jgi:hypothetical protein
MSTTTFPVATDRNQVGGVGSRELHEDSTPVRAKVVVVESPGLRWTGECTCGWLGRTRRMLRSMVVVDALTHAHETGHEPALPLIVRAG